MSRLPALALCALLPAQIQASVALTGPDGTVHLKFTTNASGHLVYSLAFDGKPRLEVAPAGVVVDGQDLGSAVSLGEPRTRPIYETFPWRGGKAMATNSCNATEIKVRTSAGLEWSLEARVFNDGAAFRFRIPGSGLRRISGESTAWHLPRQATIWLQTNTGDYEGEYHSVRVDELPLKETVDNKERVTHIGLPMTAACPDGGFMLVSEAALYKDSGMTLNPVGDGRLRSVFEDDPNGWQHDGEIVSPWRVAVLSPDLNGIVNSDVIPALCDPPDPKLFPEGLAAPWLRPGKAPCTWMVYGNDGAQWDRQKWFVDVSAAMGCEYLLVDAGWRTERWGWMKDGGDLWARAAELCRYAADRRVGIILWHAYPEGRDDGPGLTTVEAREELFQQCRKAGVKGVKIDFFNSESKAVVEAYEDLLQRSARHQLLINFHGANKPTGEVRTWPNEITREGIREQEYVLWGELPLQHYGALPFTRLAAGHADFLPGYVQKRFLKNTTSMFQMASVIVHGSPFLCWPDNPEAYLSSPLLQFARSVPITWDETRVLQGSAIGDTVLIGRRKGSAWYVAALNCRAQAQSVNLDLGFAGLAGKELTVYEDGEDGAACRIGSGVKPPADGRLALLLRPGGGCVVVIDTPKTFTGWK